MKQFLAILILLCTYVGIAQPSKSPVVYKLQGHSDDLECLALSVNGAYIASGSWDGMVNIFKTDSNYTPMTSMVDHFSAVNCISITPNNKVLATAGNDGKVFTYKIDSLGNVSKDKSASIHRMSINALFIDPSGKTVYTGSNDGTMSIFDLAKSKDKRITNTNPITSIAVTNDRRFIFCSDNTISIKKYDVMGKLSATLDGHTDQVNCIILSKDNKFLISASSDKTIKVWNLQKNKVEKTFTGHDWKVLTVALSKDGKYLVSGSNDGSLKLWDFESGKELQSFDDIGSNVRSVAISADNSKIYAAMHYTLDSFETAGILVLKTGITPVKKEITKIPGKTPAPKGTTTPTKPGTTTPGSTTTPGTTKEIIKKTSEIEISEEKKKTTDTKKDADRKD